ncbi:MULTISPECIES: DUF1827 family protein [Streptococcus]|uniref:DUF1827 family protein n=1 Tax=Streptococcus caledonicus TaxID=2614158 RepID=A0ABW0UEY4_9STRE|nr:DUF1827 family protein [Streptococcus sp. S784/96/1]
MRLINTTNSHAELVVNQLRNTDATLVEVYSAGNTDVIFTQAPRHYELLITNKHRAIQDKEIEQIRDFFMRRKIDQKICRMDLISTIHTSRLIEISIPTQK